MTRLQKVYYILGIIQRIAMVILTFLFVGVAYKAMSIMNNFQLQINDIQNIVNKLFILIDKSWLF